MKRMFVFLLAIWCVLCGMSEQDALNTSIVRSAHQKVAKVASQQNNHLKGLDRCTENGRYADQFTIDRRCYVTDEQKKMFPYNTVVGLQTQPNPYGHYIFCTGVITKNPYDSKLYIYTAGHCARDDRNEVFALTQDNKVFPTTNIVKESSFYLVQDYAVYSIPQEYQDLLPYTTSANNINTNVDQLGYGALEILSDNAIRKAKQEWKNILNSASGEEKNILKQVSSYTLFFPYDNSVLKASFDCNPYRLTNSNNFCQAHKGDSGGPVFNKDGKVAAVRSWGLSINFTDDNYVRAGVAGMQTIATIDSVMNQQIDVANAKIIDTVLQKDEHLTLKQQTREIRQQELKHSLQIQ